MLALCFVWLGLQRRPFLDLLASFGAVTVPPRLERKEVGERGERGRETGRERERETEGETDTGRGTGREKGREFLKDRWREGEQAERRVEG